MTKLASTSSQNGIADSLSEVKPRGKHELGDDNSPILWESSDGSQVVTQDMYSDWVSKAERGGLIGYHSGDDVDKELERLGLTFSGQKQAPAITDINNATTPEQQQAMLDELNGIVGSNPAWSEAYRHRFPYTVNRFSGYYGV